MPRYPMFMAAAAAVAMVCAAPAGAQTTLRLAHYAQESHPAHKAALMMAEGVDKRTNGALKIKVFPSNQLGDGNEVLEQQIRGGIDISLPTQPMLDKYGAAGDKPFAVVMLPFVYKSYEHAWKVLDGPFADWVATRFQQIGLVHLANWEWGFRNLTNNAKPIKAPADLKGLKIRTPAEVQLQSTMEAAGAVVAMISFAELTMSLKLNVVDGQENPLSVIWHNKLYETQKHLSLTNHVYNSMMAVISAKTWEKLKPDQQAILKEEAKKAGQWFRDQVLVEERDLVAKLREKGMVVTEPDREAFRAVMGPAYEKIAGYAGKANVDKFLEMVASVK